MGAKESKPAFLTYEEALKRGTNINGRVHVTVFSDTEAELRQRQSLCSDFMIIIIIKITDTCLYETSQNPAPIFCWTSYIPVTTVRTLLLPSHAYDNIIHMWTKLKSKDWSELKLYHSFIVYNYNVNVTDKQTPIAATANDNVNDNDKTTQVPRQ